MTIKVYPSQMPGEPIETHQHALCTIAAWFDEKGLDYKAWDQQPATVLKNGVPVAVVDWVATEIRPDDVLEIRLIPHGGVFKALGSIIGKVFNIAFGWLMPSTKGAGSSQTEQGAQIKTSDATANSAKLGAVVPELAGRHRRFPDYLTPPRRYFINRREQWLEFLCCIGPGRYQIADGDVKVGGTPFAALGADAQYGIYTPGTDLSGVAAHEHWYTVAEVGGTSSGTAGLELSTEIGNRQNEDPGYYIFAGANMNREQGEYPSGWGVGTYVLVQFPRPYDILTRIEPPTGGGDGGETPGYSISQITGWFGHVPSNIGDAISLGAFDAITTYRVRRVVATAGNVKTLELETLAGATPVVLTPGTGRILLFGSNVSRFIASYADNSMALSPGGFEGTTIVGALARFNGGEAFGEWTSEFAASPSNEVSDLIEFDVFWPNGLAYIADNGSVQARGVGIEFQYRNIAGGSRVTYSRYYQEATLDQIGVTERINVPPAQWMCRMRRVGAESTSTQVQDKAQWYGLRTRLRTRTSYPNWTVMSIRLRGGGRLSAQSENQINVVAERMLPTLQGDGSWGGEQPTRDISAFGKYIASSIGYADADINIDEMRRLHSIWVGRGETLDFVFDETTVKAALNVAFGAGMAELTIDDGQIKPVRDDPRTQFEQAYSPQNMTSPLRRSFVAPKPDDPDGIEIEYISANTWTKETVRCFLPGDQGFKLQKERIDGVTNRDIAWRIGMRMRRAQRYQMESYSFKTEMDALNSGYLSYVPLLDDIPGYGQSSILEHIESHPGGALLHLSEPMAWEEGASHVIAYRRPDGKLAGPYPATRGIDDYTVIAPIPIPWPEISLKQEPPHAYFGTSERWSFPALITNIRPESLDEVSVTAKKYDERIYADDHNNAPT